MTISCFTLLSLSFLLYLYIQPLVILLVVCSRREQTIKRKQEERKRDLKDSKGKTRGRNV